VLLAGEHSPILDGVAEVILRFGHVVVARESDIESVGDRGRP
jgi:hypothetical protein